MTAFLLPVGALATWAIIATIAAVRVDGYRRVPTTYRQS